MSASSTSPLYLTRFVAAYLVLLFHYATPALRAWIPSSRHFDEPVNYFFFISGFVMVISNAKYLRFGGAVPHFSRWAFWLRRIARIYPMYFLALFLFVLFNYTASEIDASIPKRIWLELSGMQRWIYNGSINFPGWTVSCEFLFYFLFPFSLPILVTRPLARIAIFTVALLASSILFTFYFKRSIPRIESLSSAHLLHMLTSSILLHPIFKYTVFLSGCLCGRYYLEGKGMATFKKFSQPIALVSAVSIVLFYKYDLVAPIVLSSGILCFVYFPFILAVCSLPTALEKLFSWRPFIFLGEISYGIYIMQAPVEHYFEYIFLGNVKIGQTWQFFAYTFFLIAICSVLYYAFERPLRNVIVRHLGQRPTRVAVLP